MPRGSSARRRAVLLHADSEEGRRIAISLLASRANGISSQEISRVSPLCATLRAVRVVQNERNFRCCAAFRCDRESRESQGSASVRLPSGAFPICIVGVEGQTCTREQECGNESESVSGTATAVPAAKSCQQPSRAFSIQTASARTSVFACAKNASGSGNNLKLCCDGTSVPVADIDSENSNPNVKLHNMFPTHALDLGPIPLGNSLL
jgi:hypothetical protein